MSDHIIIYVSFFKISFMFKNSFEKIVLYFTHALFIAIHSEILTLEIFGFIFADF